jgi:hypothetical protein
VLGDLPWRLALAAACRVFFSGMSCLPSERAKTALLAFASIRCQCDRIKDACE